MSNDVDPTRTCCLHSVCRLFKYPSIISPTEALPQIPTNAQVIQFPASLTHLVLADIDALCAEVLPCLCYLLHEFLVRLWYVVEGEDTPAELEEEVCAERDESPERKLSVVS